MDYTEEFEEFYRAYPRRIAKGQAFRTFKAIIKEVPLDTILSALQMCVYDWEALNTKPTFIPHPSTWLNQRRWDDDRPDTGTDYRAPDVAPGPAGGHTGGVPEAPDREIPF